MVRISNFDEVTTEDLIVLRKALLIAVTQYSNIGDNESSVRAQNLYDHMLMEIHERLKTGQ